MTQPHSISHMLDVDPQTAALIAAEERRQREKIILIPSESLTSAPVREALGSAFTSVYAEGYPRKAMMRQTQDQLADLDAQLASYRRYADRRFYKGAEFADLVESLAGRRACECFATPEIPAEQIYANVQPLSGAAANLAVYDAFVRPGETVMGMALTEGGHLTHGSEFNVTGKRYNIVSYAVDRKTGKLDYDQIRQLAETHRPRMIIGGFTSYPWKPDWRRFREIADAVGAILLADVAHTAGLIVGGVYPNPIGIAHVVSFTTHKTLCGGRGAVILSTDPAIASRIDTAIFPGEQGGPHVNKFAALAVALRAAQSPAFAELQKRIIDNAAALARALADEGLTLAYGGTDTHLLLVDLRTLPSETGFVMMGEIASRILDLAGIVCNKNTLPGDTSAADAHGIRFGTPWVSQRGMGEEEMKRLAGIIARILRSIRPFSYQGLRGELSRGKLPLSVLEQARRDVRALIGHVDPRVQSVPRNDRQEEEGLPWTALRARSGRAGALLNEAVPAELRGREARSLCTTYLFDADAQAVAEIQLAPMDRDDYLILVPSQHAEAATSWLKGLADGYVLFDQDDLFRKVQGPAVIEPWDEEIPAFASTAMKTPLEEDVAGQSIQAVYAKHPERFATNKEYFIGQASLAPEDGAGRAPFDWHPSEGDPLKRTPLHGAHVELGAKLVPFAGWEMPVWYTSALEEHRAVRRSAGLFDLGHMGVFQVEGEYAGDFVNAVTSNYAAWLEDGQSQYAYLFDPSGRILDDIMVYRRAWNRYLVVVNASNEQKDWAWLNGVNERRFAIDAARPERIPGPPVTLRDLKSERQVIDLALQGPKSAEILGRLLAPAEQRTIAALDRTEFAEITVDGHQLMVARTGYTGESLGYEIYAAGPDAQWLWYQLLETGRPLGLLPCGLASRDSTRTEAGLPLYGHELAGPHEVNPYEAGFASYIKLHKPFFSGREACLDAYRATTREIIRFAVEAGARPVRDGALVLDRNGTVLGRVTSCVSLGDAQIGLALVDRLGLSPKTALFLLQPGRSKSTQAPLEAAQSGERLPVPTRAIVVPRFPSQTNLPQDGGE